MESNFLIIIPFILLLLSISFVPLLDKKFWKKYYAVISFSLAALVALFYFIVLKDFSGIISSIEEYLSFIVLLFSLFVISGGVFFNIRGDASPEKNVLLLLVGSVAANIFGTTGAAMLLIRPFLNSNRHHLKPYHIVFFIFLICNIGGCLTPVADPPLFIGFLRGIPFFWITGNMIVFWVISLIYLLSIFYIIDKNNFKKLGNKIQLEIKSEHELLKFRGLYNILFLVAVIGCVFISKPIFLREILMLLITYVSYRITPKEIHQLNKFSFKPITEVVVLFFGIFVTLTPVIAYLTINSKELNITTPAQYFWLTGLLTSILDNAPTYLNALTLSMSTFNLSNSNVADVLSYISNYREFIVAISVSSVFFGAMTYIGHGPNLMVISISENKKIEIPGFLQYIYKYSLPILLPLFIILWLLFFH